MNAEDRLLENGYDGVKYLTNYSYDDAPVVINRLEDVYIRVDDDA